ncbi:MAG: A24 family peptidase [Dehalococcoidia bacterium]|nr:A24 family peptidase [Dehalococcoidia bacterium]
MQHNWRNELVIGRQRRLATASRVSSGAGGPDDAEMAPLSPSASAFARSPWPRLLFAAVALAVIVGAAFRYQDVSQVAVIAVYAAVLVSCAATDLATFRVPNVITYPAILFAVLVAAIMPGADFLSAIAGGGVAFGLMLFALIVSRGAMGLGDVKLATFAGFAVGWPLIAPTLILMALAGGVSAFILLVLRVKGRRDPIPYAPFISVGALTVILWQGTAFAAL